MATGPPPFNNIVYGLYSSPSGSLPEQGNSEVAIPKDEKSSIQSYYHQTGGNLVACGTSGGPGYCQAIGGMGLSAGSDPISEAGRPQRYLRRTVLRRPKGVQSLHLRSASPTRKDDLFEGADSLIHDKSYVFVTYGDPVEVAIDRLGGVFHMDRKLACRPGPARAARSPFRASSYLTEDNAKKKSRLLNYHLFSAIGNEGVAFRQDDLNGGAFRWKLGRRFNRYDSILDEQQRSYQFCSSYRANNIGGFGPRGGHQNFSAGGSSSMGPGPTDSRKVQHGRIRSPGYG
ncbi:hypothetical protein G7054_g13080 [Neopestalotiopsis clavispora]|nr:hypothetical protein G7054_g13080 [Neopestalotiopsis clavispora]